MTNYIKNLRIIYFLTLISPILLIGVFSLTIEKGTVMLNDSINDVFQYLVPMFGLVFIPIGFILFNMRLKSIKTNEAHDIKLQLYRGIFVQRIAFIEGVAIFSAVAFILTLNILYVAYSLFALAFYLPIYPTRKRINNDLGIMQNSIDKLRLEENNKSFWGKNPWIILLLVGIMIFLNYTSFKNLISNKVVLPAIQVDKGTITDSIYHNDYLDWTFIIPSGYQEIPLEEIEKYEKKGSEILNTKASNDDETIRLLNISNGLVDFKSNLYPRVLFPNIINEEKYLELIEKQFKNAKVESVTFEKQDQGFIKIDSLEFNYIEYFVIGQKRVGMIYLTKLNNDFIFDISMVYQDSQQGIELLNRLKISDLNWE